MLYKAVKVYVRDCPTIKKAGVQNCTKQSVDYKKKMYKIFFVQITFLLQILVEISAENKTENLQELEKQKGELFDNINSAIDESVRLLKDANDSDAALGVTYMQKLKDQLKEINSDFNHTEVNDTRRSSKMKMNIFELARIFQKGKSEVKLERDANTKVIKKKIDNWIEEREKEKQKIQQYKEKLKMSGKVEKCPRYGFGKKERKKTRRNNNLKKSSAKKTKYPCCRKCCKNSYMGCL